MIELGMIRVDARVSADSGRSGMNEHSESCSAQDERFMAQALELARQGTALTSPGARVGAVVLDQSGAVAGTAFYTYAGLKHAEVLAIEQAGERARGGTLYVNLEPCSHHGRTPPCADLVIRSGIRRVVGGIVDPNPLVAGSGLTKLRNAGIEVANGVLECEARRVNESFARYIRDRRPLVTLKSAMTLDGKIAAQKTAAGSASSSFITGAGARAHVQELRHEADAIMVGVGTVLADDPLLTDRTGRPRRRPLLRVVLDSHLRLPAESRLVQTAADDLLVFCCGCDEDRKRALEARGVRVKKVAADPREGRIGLHAVMEHLGEMEIASLLIEGGAHVNGAALSSGIVDKVFLYFAPTILGRTGAVPFSCGPAFEELFRVNNLTLHQFGDDVALEGYLRDPFAATTQASVRKVG